MFESIRQHQRVLLGFLLLLIFPAFAFFGISGYDRMFSDQGVVAHVDGDRITTQEYDLAQRRQIENMRQVLGDKFDPRQFETPQARAEIVDSLVVQRVLARKAAADHIAVPDALLRSSIASIPGLRRDDGTFDAERYRAMLAAQGKSEVGFEAEMRRDLALEVLPNAISLTEFIPKAVLEQLMLDNEQRRDVRELVFRGQDFAAQVKPQEAELRKFYDENANFFLTPESANVEFLVLSRAALAAQVALKPDEVKEYYEQNKARFGTKEERRASHILIATGPKMTQEAALAKANELLAKLRGGADFAALAKADSQDPGSAAQGGDLGYFTRDTMTKAFADAAFALKVGELSAPVATEFGVHLIKLTGIKGGAVAPFEQVRAQIEAEIRNQQGGAKFAELADGFTNTVYEQPDSLKPAAERYKLTIQRFDGLTRTGSDKLPPDSPLRSQKVVEALFAPDSIRTKRNTEAVDIGNGTLVSARIAEYHPTSRPKFEDVQERVRAAYVEREAVRLAVAAGEKKLKDLTGTTGAADGFGAVKTVSRAAPGEFSREAMERIMSVPAKPLPAYVGVNRGASGYAVLRIEKISLPTADELALRRPQYRQQANQLWGRQALVDYLSALKAGANVKIVDPAASSTPVQQ